jgi:ligand-binding sensor domain-containing protein/signal transduction histidine kinase
VHRIFTTWALKGQRLLALGLAASTLVCATARAALPAEEGDPGVVVRCWKTPQGLPQNSVTALLQTRDHYLWVGTKSGLARFDGVRFRPFAGKDGLPSGTISALLEARDGALWVGTPDRGLFCYQNGRGTNVLSYRRITDLAETDDGTLWIGSSAGLDRWKGGQVAHMGETEGLPKSRVNSLYIDRAGTLWVGTADKGIFRLRDGKFASEPAPYKYQHLGYCFLEDQGGALWLSTGNGFLLRKKGGEWQTYDGPTNGVPYNYVPCLAQTANGTLWAGSTGDGLVYLKEDRFIPFTTRNGLSDDYVMCALADREGNLWAGTAVGGLNRLTPKHLVTLAAPQGLTHELVRSIVESADGALWAATRNGGLYRGDHNHFAQYRSPHIPEGVVAAYNYPGVYLGSESILAAHDNTLWLGGPAALFHLGETNSKLFKVSEETKWLQDSAVTSLAEDAHHTVWAGTSRGDILFSREGSFFPVEYGSKTAPVAAITCGADGTVWAGTRGAGVLQLRSNTFAAKLTSRQGLGSDFVTALHVGRDGTLWIGTEDGGLNRWKDGRCFAFPPRQGLPEGRIVQILEDDEGDLWLGGMHGICRVKRSDLESLATQQLAVVQPLTLGEEQGMLSEECSSGSSPNCLKSRNGRLYFATMKGLVVIDPKQYRSAESPPLARVEEVVFNGKIVSENAEGGKVVIPPGRGNLEIHYTGLGNAVLEGIQFRYQLIGVDPDWVEAGRQRTAYYSHLPPGEYHFQVITCGGGRLWPESRASMDLELRPHFYETRLFFASLLILSALALVQVVRVVSHRRLQRQLHWAEMQNAVEMERSRIAKDIHDDLGASLTQVSMLSEFGQDATGQPEVAGQTFGKIADASRLAVEALDEIVWAVNPKNDTLPRLVRYICLYADECFDSSPIRCWQKVPADLPHLPVRAEVRHNLFLAVKEALNNILKHSGATEAWLQIQLQDHSLHLEIKDNGRGFSVPQADFTRSGLSNMKTRLAEAEGTMELDSQPNGGTRVHFVVPLPATPEPPFPNDISMS